MKNWNKNLIGPLLLGVIAILYLGKNCSVPELENLDGSHAVKASDGDASSENSELSSEEGGRIATPVEAISNSGVRVIQVVDHLGEPVQRSTVIAFDGNGDCFAGEEVVGAVAAFSFDDRVLKMSSLLVVSEARPPTIIDIPIESFSQVVLEEGGVVSGQVYVNGEIATSNIPLALRWHSSSLADIPIEVLEFASIDPEKRSTAFTATNDKGRFHFGGLPLDWYGAISSNSIRYYHENQDPAFYASHWVELSHPTDNLILRLLETPMIRGRIMIDADEPSSNGIAIVDVLGEKMSLTTDGEIQDDGSFAAPVRTLQQMSIQDVSVRAFSQPFPLQVWENLDLPKDLDLGSLYLRPSKEIFVRGFGEDQRVLTSLKLRQELQKGFFGGWTGQWEEEKNATYFRPEATEKAIWAWAPSFQSTKIDLAQRQTSDGVYEIELRPSPSLSVQLLAENPEDFKKWTVQIYVPRNSFEVGTGQKWDEVVVDRGSKVARMLGRPGGSIRWVFKVNSQGELVVNGFPPQSEVFVSVVPVNGIPFISESIGRMPEEGQLSKEYKVESGFIRLFGVLQSVDGKAILPDRFDIRAIDEEGNSFWGEPISCGERGEFSFNCPCGATIGLEIEKKGFESLAVSIETGGEVEKEILLEMKRVHPFIVRLEDEGGKPLSGRIEARWDSGGTTAMREEVGIYRLDLPPLVGDFEVSVFSNGGEYFDFPSTRSPMVITLPMQGNITATLPENISLEANAQGVSWWLFIEPKTSNHSPLHLRIPANGESCGQLAPGRYSASLYKSDKPGVRPKPVGIPSIEVESQNGVDIFVNFNDI